MRVMVIVKPGEDAVSDGVSQRASVGFEGEVLLAFKVEIVL